MASAVASLETVFVTSVTITVSHCVQYSRIGSRRVVLLNSHLVASHTRYLRTTSDGP